MKRKNKKLTMAVGMVLGVTVLAGAALASYNTSNGYEVGKNALKGLLENENYTAELKFNLADDEDFAELTLTELYDRDGEVSLNRTEVGLCSYAQDSVDKIYEQDDKRISYHKIGGEEYTNIYEYRSINSTGIFDEFSDFEDNDRETADKIIRFVELVGDTMVGDLKNNIVYVSGDDNFSTYEINLDAIQVPEYVNAGLSALFSSARSYNYEDDPFRVYGNDPIVSNASLKFTVDNEGRFTDGIGSATIVSYDENDEKHEITASISLKMYDYGTTVPQRVDIETLPNVEYMDYRPTAAVEAVVGE